MGTMTAVDAPGRFTRADLDAMPDDGRRYELLDGAIVVAPAPGKRHQIAVTGLWQLLQAAAPEGVRALVAPFDVALPTGDVLEPDVLVAHDRLIRDTDVSQLLLAVEVLSPSSRRRDVGDKLTAYQDAGVPSYWVVDPVDPRLRVWELREGSYVEVADVSGSEEWTAATPYPVTVRPDDLLK